MFDYRISGNTQNGPVMPALILMYICAIAIWLYYHRFVIIQWCSVGQVDDSISLHVTEQNVLQRFCNLFNTFIFDFFVAQSCSQEHFKQIVQDTFLELVRFLLTSKYIFENAEYITHFVRSICNFLRQLVQQNVTD